MVCQLDLTTTSTSTTTTPSKTSTPINTNRIINHRSNQQLLTSLSLTLLTTTTNNNRRTSSTILHKTADLIDQNDVTLIKNAISLDNLEFQQQQHEFDQKQQQPEEEICNQISMEYLNDNTLVHSLPDLDSLVLNKCYLFNKKDFRSNLSLSNKNDIDDDDDDDVDDDDDFDDEIILNRKPVISSSESSSPSSNENNLMSISPSLSNETNSSCNNNNHASPLSHDHVLIAPPPIISSRKILPLNPNYLAAEIVSISSLTSNYSQFDFVNEQPKEQQQQKLGVGIEKKSNSFSAFFNRFTSSNKSKATVLSTKNINASSNGLFSGAFKLFQSAGGDKVTKSNSDYTVPSTVLILENRPR
jgi:hypothetical protein